VAGGNDILSLMLESPEVFSDEVIIDEMLGFFGAAADPTSKGLQTILSYLSKTPESQRKVRTEFDSKFADLCKEEPRLASLSLAE